MLRPPFTGHRRHSITHRAVQRLRELVPGREEEDDENLRDKLDTALAEAQEAGKAVRTLDAMLGEPQTLVPLDAFGDLLYAIIKEDTVVTVLPKSHGEEILQRGQAMEQRVAAGQGPRPAERPEERWEPTRRRWRKDSQQPVVIERIVRGANGQAERNGVGGHDDDFDDHHPVSAAYVEDDVVLPAHPVANGAAELPRAVSVERQRERVLDDPIARALQAALDRGRRRAAVSALADTLRHHDRESSLLPLWNALAEGGIPQTMTIGDLIEAVQAAADERG